MSFRYTDSPEGKRGCASATSLKVARRPGFSPGSGRFRQGSTRVNRVARKRSERVAARQDGGPAPYTVPSSPVTRPAGRVARGSGPCDPARPVRPEVPVPPRQEGVPGRRHPFFSGPPSAPGRPDALLVGLLAAAHGIVTAGPRPLAVPGETDSRLLPPSAPWVRKRLPEGGLARPVARGHDGRAGSAPEMAWNRPSCRGPKARISRSWRARRRGRAASGRGRPCGCGRSPG